MKRLFCTATITALMLATLGCSSQNFAVSSENQEFGTKVNYNTEVDVLVVIDTSPSMAKHQEALADQMPALVAALDRTKLDYRVAVTTMDLGGGTANGKFVGTPAVLPFYTSNLGQVLANRVRLGENGGLEEGLGAMYAALTSPNIDGPNAGFLRQNALLSVIFLSNEEDHSSSRDYETFLNGLKPALPSGARSWIANFIGVLPGDTSCQTSDWGYFSPGSKYKALADASGGRSENICTGSLSSAVSNIRKRIMEIITEYSLGDRTANESTIKVYLNGELVPKDDVNGWTFVESRNTIIFHGSYLPLVGSLIRVDFKPKEIQ